MLQTKTKIKVLIPLLVLGLTLSSVWSVLNFSTLINTDKALVAKAAEIDSITYKTSWVGNDNSGQKVDASLPTWGGSYSMNINPGVQDIYVRQDGTIDLIQRSDEGYQFGSIFDTNGIKKFAYPTFNDDDGGESITGNSQYTYMARRIAAVSTADAAEFPAGALPLKNNDPAV